MPFQYAVLELIPRSDTPLNDMHFYNSDRVFHPVTKEVAEGRADGYFCLTNNHGEQFGVWIQLHGPHTEHVERAIKTAKSNAPPHKDIMGQELAIGDYVAWAFTTGEMSIAKVIAFRVKQVRLVVYGRSYDVMSKYPSGLVKIHPSVISD